jgi:hypothetical protein
MPRKALDCVLDQPGIWIAPVGSLTPMTTYDEGKKSYREIVPTLDNSPMNNPVLCWAMPLAEWTRRIASRVEGRDVVPVIIGDQFVWAVKHGNQRVQYAKLRGYTHIAAVLLDDEHACNKWLRWYID